MTNLTSLGCCDNESDISHMSNLTSLECYDNESDISELTLTLLNGIPK